MIEYEKKKSKVKREKENKKRLNDWLVVVVV